MTWVQRMYTGLGEYLRSKGVDAITVIGLEESASSGYEGCETCGYGESSNFETEIYYLDKDGVRMTYYYSGSFADLISGIV